MKRLMTMLMALLLCAACIPAVAEDTEIAADGGLTLLSPETFFDGKYTFFNAADNIEVGSTWITYSFRLVGEGEKEAVEADAESYRQALADSGYFVRMGEYDLAYTGDQEVAVARASGKEQGWQVNVNVSGGYSDIPYTIRVNLVEDFAFSDIAAGGGKEDTVSGAIEEVILPDPGYYFGRVYADNIIWFDEYPIDEYEAYVSLLTESYGMKITKEQKQDDYRTCFLLHPDADYAEVYVGCVQDSNDNWALQLAFWGDITLSVLDTYGTPIASASGEIVWDDGRMIADPGDFLGYAIECFEIADDTGSSTKGYMKYRYRAIPVEDIHALADAFDASPYFESSGSLESEWYWLLYFDYTGADPETKELCAEGRKEIGDYFRHSDLSIYIHDPYAAESEFDIYEYPGFTVNSQMEEVSYDGDGCPYCQGDGKCDECGGTSWVWVTEWEYGADGLPELVTNNEFCSAIYCNGGSCTECGGSGQK